jgi:hypothetical protein
MAAGIAPAIIRLEAAWVAPVVVPFGAAAAMLVVVPLGAIAAVVVIVTLPRFVVFIAIPRIIGVNSSRLLPVAAGAASSHAVVPVPYLSDVVPIRFIRIGVSSAVIEISRHIGCSLCQNRTGSDPALTSYECRGASAKGICSNIAAEDSGHIRPI